MDEKIKMEDAFSESDVKLYSRGDTITGTVVQVNENEVLVDIGYKSEGILPVKELSPFREEKKVEEGEKIEVLVTYIDEEKGTVYASERQAEYEKRIDLLQEAHKDGSAVEGEITNEVRNAGYHVNLDGIRAFLPGSHLGKDLPSAIEELKDKRLSFKILELSRRDKNLVVSHRAWLEDEAKKQQIALFNSLEEEQEIEGVIRSIVDFGLFIDIGGFEGLCHRSEIAWKNLPVPPPEYKVGDKVKTKIIGFDKEKGKISLSIKRLRPDPWKGISERYPVGARVKGEIVSVTDFGAFVQLEQDIEGLIHVSELSWGYPEKPAEVVTEGDELEVVVLSCDEAAHRVSLSLRRTQRDPWEDVEAKYPQGQRITGAVTKITDFGAFVRLEEGIEGLVHVSELDWGHINHPRDVLKEGEEVEVKVLHVDKKERRISLSIRELKVDPWREFLQKFSIDEIVEGEITEIKDFGAFMRITEDVEGLIHVSEITDQRIATPDEILSIGDKTQAKIIGINEEKKQVRLSMRHLFERAPSGPRKRSRKKEKSDLALAESTGHETLSMRDLLEDKPLDLENEE
ncbi:S1 RNA-binding domain-containing protein, partial [Candidatus Bipolaricaulota bacterium]|nr:S1 RNA-binding domain-containing protein [Candidatus Bipolaricaulota bacterium]